MLLAKKVPLHTHIVASSTAENIMKALAPALLAILLKSTLHAILTLTQVESSTLVYSRVVLLYTLLLYDDVHI